MLLNIVLIIGGFMLLVAGANYLIEGASAVAQRLGISSLVIGLTVVAFGTSLPELVVNLISATSGSTELALGNINGSNIANILLILGVTAFLTRVPVRSRTVMKEIPYMVLAGAVLAVMSADAFFGNGDVGMISRSEGALLICFFLIFVYYLFLSAKDVAGQAAVEQPKVKLPRAGLYVAMGVGGLVIGGKLAVDGAVGVALGFGISETLAGLTILALGTSLPELVSSVVAALKKETDLAIGNIVGSNIFNILLVLGVTSIVQPVSVSAGGLTDTLVALGAMLLLCIVLFLPRKGERKQQTRDIQRTTGLIFITLYLAYIVYIALRG